MTSYIFVTDNKEDADGTSEIRGLNIPYRDSGRERYMYTCGWTFQFIICDVGYYR